MIEVVNFYQLKHLFMNVTLNTEENKKEVKGFIKGWNNMSITDLVAINMKRQGDIYNQIYFTCNRTFIVFDTDEQESFNIMIEFLQTHNLYNPACITKSFRGITIPYKRHFWFNLEYVTNNTELFHPGQIKFNGGEIFHGEGCILGEYRDSYIDVQHMPYLKLDIYNKLYAVLNNDIITPVTPRIVKQKPVLNEVLVPPMLPTEVDMIKNKDLIELIDGLKSSRFNSYADWLTFYFISINENFDKSIFEYYSKKSHKYNKINNDKLLSEIKVYKKGYTLATLYYWLQQDNKTLFNIVCKSRTDFWNMFIDHHSMAKLYYNLYHDKYIYSYGSGWFEYNDNNILINRNKVPISIYNSFTKTMQEYATEQRNMVKNEDEKFKEKMKFFLKFHSKAGDTGFIDKSLKQLCGFYHDDELEKNMNKQHILAFNNVLYDSNLNEFRIIQKSDFITLTCGYDLKYNIIGSKIIPIINDVLTTKATNIINSIFENDELNEYWLYVTALSLFGNIKEKFYIHCGIGGNGKGLTQRIIFNCLGNYYKQVSNMFLMGSINKGGADSELAGCIGVRYLSISEPDDIDNKKFNISNLKSYSGGDLISCRALHKDTMQYMPQFTIHIGTNEIPKMSNMDGGIKRRINIIDYPFMFKDKTTITNTAVERPINYELKDTVINNPEFIQAFILLLINISHKYKNIVLATPQKILNNNADYDKNNNELQDWFNASFVKTDNSEDILKSGDLMALYNTSIYCIKKLRPVDFSKLMADLNIPKKTGKYSLYTNIKLYVDDS